ncbi:hypothetical protein [Rhizorhabdus phycosphaerae]|uniref:hypothetical protein n=1 Tax=Rhizorhabdus phycosphaerae TaxID=2711156 RepID=UPI0013EDE902|nr:hypothetical protein [Rhizorhabdus phycosphaerae]
MMALLLPSAAILLTTTLIALLAAGDPKRRRSARLSGDGQGKSLRRVLAAFACLPGAVLAAMGDAAGFMLWLGGAAVAGWFVALLFAQTRQETR